MKNKKIKVNGQDVKLKKKLGEGNSATIYQTSIENCVAKITFKNNLKGFQSYKNEQNIFIKLNQLQSHQGIVDYLGSSDTININGKAVSVILLEYCSQGSLIDVLTTLPNFKPTEELVLLLMRDVLNGIINLHHVFIFQHQIGVTHRDIKMENVLLSHQGKFKLCDFGSGTQLTWIVTKENIQDLQDDIEQNTTPFYRAPEQLNLYSGYPINEKVDVFALGVMIYMFCFQKPPFESALAAINTHYFLPINNQYSPQLIQLIKMMFEPNPQIRPHAEELLQRVYLTQKIALPICLSSTRIVNFSQQQKVVQDVQQSQQGVHKVQNDLNNKIIKEYDFFADFSHLQSVDQVVRPGEAEKNQMDYGISRINAKNEYMQSNQSSLMLQSEMKDKITFNTDNLDKLESQIEETQIYKNNNQHSVNNIAIDQSQQINEVLFQGLKQKEQFDLIDFDFDLSGHKDQQQINSSQNQVVQIIQKQTISPYNILQIQLDSNNLQKSLTDKPDYNLQLIQFDDIDEEIQIEKIMQENN